MPNLAETAELEDLLHHRYHAKQLMEHPEFQTSIQEVVSWVGYTRLLAQELDVSTAGKRREKIKRSLARFEAEYAYWRKVHSSEFKRFLIQKLPYLNQEHPDNDYVKSLNAGAY